MDYTLHRRGFLAGSALGLSAQPALSASTLSNTSDPGFKLGMVTYNISAEWDVPTILKTCKEVGVDGVELRTTHKHGVEPALGSDQRKEIKHRFADAGITLWGLGSTCEFHSPDSTVVKKNIETCKAFLQLAHDLDARGVKVRPNGLPKGEKRIPHQAFFSEPCCPGHQALLLYSLFKNRRRKAVAVVGIVLGVHNSVVRWPSAWVAVTYGMSWGVDNLSVAGG